MVHRLIPILILAFACSLLVSSYAIAEDYVMVPTKQHVLGSDQAYRSHQLVDFDNDGFDDLAVLFSNGLLVYSFATDSILWSVPGSEFAGFIIDDVDSDGTFDAILYTCDWLLYSVAYPDSFPHQTGRLTAYTATNSSCARAHLDIRDLGHNGTRELIVTQRIARLYLCQFVGDYESWYNVFAFSLPDLTQLEFFDHRQFRAEWSDSITLPGDLDGDGLQETIGFGRQVGVGCAGTDSPSDPYTYDVYDLFVYNQLGQSIAYERGPHATAATVGDFDPGQAGDECIAKLTQSYFDSSLISSSENHHLFSLKLVNGSFDILWSREADEYLFDFLHLPDFPQLFGLEYAGGPVWQMFDGSNGSIVHGIYGLAARRITLGGRFTPAADTGLQIVQLSADTITLYGRALPTDINDDPANAPLPDRFTLYPNYPNPFNPTTEIRFALPIAADVSLRVFNIRGQLVATLIAERLSAGEHTVTWNATGFSSGVYLYRLSAGDVSLSRKMILLK